MRIGQKRRLNFARQKTAQKQPAQQTKTATGIGLISQRSYLFLKFIRFAGFLSTSFLSVFYLDFGKRLR